MRSESEIKEELKYYSEHGGYPDALDWVLEGPPCYSIFKLEKISKAIKNSKDENILVHLISGNSEMVVIEKFINLLKDYKLMEKILNEK